MSEVFRLAGAETIAFRCPGCNEAHVVRVAGPGAWAWNGDIQRPTLSPSVLVTSGHFSRSAEGRGCWCTFNDSQHAEPTSFRCQRCHSFIRDGKIEFLSDCSHHLAGETVEIPAWEEA